MEDYEALLKKAYTKLPKLKVGKERFEVPSVDIAIHGSQTIIKNFAAIATTIRRDSKHLLRFLSKELAAPSHIDAGRAILQAKLSQSAIQTKLESYVKEYVVCKECKRPDTRLEKQDRITVLACEACGAKVAVKAI